MGGGVKPFDVVRGVNELRLFPTRGEGGSKIASVFRRHKCMTPKTVALLT